jgi:hypothetical protein
MDLNSPLFWSVVVSVCSFALFVEVASLVRVIILTRPALWRYLFAAIPLAVSILSFIVAWNALNVDEYVAATFSHGFLAPGLAQTLREMVAQTISACQIQAGITVAVFIMILFAERRAFPRGNRPPAWVLARERAFRR